MYYSTPRTSRPGDSGSGGDRQQSDWQRTEWTCSKVCKCVFCTRVRVTWVIKGLVISLVTVGPCFICQNYLIWVMCCTALQISARLTCLSLLIGGALLMTRCVIRHVFTIHFSVVITILGGEIIASSVVRPGKVS